VFPAPRTIGVAALALASLASAAAPIKGFYVFGEVGRGKTM